MTRYAIIGRRGGLVLASALGADGVRYASVGRSGGLVLGSGELGQGGGGGWEGEWIFPTGTPSFSTDNVGTITENAPGDFSVDVLDESGPGYTDPRDGSMLVFPMLDMVTGEQVTWPAHILGRIEVVTAPAGSTGIRLGLVFLRADAPMSEANVVWAGIDYGAATPRVVAGHEGSATNGATADATIVGAQIAPEVRSWDYGAGDRLTVNRITADGLNSTGAGNSSAGYAATHPAGRVLNGKAWIGVFVKPTAAVDDAQPVRFRVGYQLLAPRGTLT